MKPKPTKYVQGKFPFIEGARRRNRTTILTVDKATYRKVLALKVAEETVVEAINDIVSSGRGEEDDAHHAIRRVNLLARAVAGDYRKVKVRTVMGTAVYCLVVGRVVGKSDACTFKVCVRKAY